LGSGLKRFFKKVVGGSSNKASPSKKSRDLNMKNSQNSVRSISAGEEKEKEK
jgi:hypothetical protein